MLGELVYEGKGKTIGVRVLPNGKLEQTQMMQGTVLGEEFSATWTSESVFKPDGTTHTEFLGYFTTKSGAMGQYSGMGNGMMRPDGSQTNRGVLCHLNAPGKYARFNGTAIVYEVEADKEGNFHNKGWEWK
jgi:hypothetical protein